MSTKAELDRYHQGRVTGQEEVAKSLLSFLAAYLPAGDLAGVTLAAEMSDARRVVRDLCEEFGDTDWDESLHLADVIDRHLGRYLKGPHWIFADEADEEGSYVDEQGNFFRLLVRRGMAPQAQRRWEMRTGGVSSPWRQRDPAGLVHKIPEREGK